MKTLLFILAMVGTAFAEDFTTTDGKEYKDAKVKRVEPDGLVLTLVDGLAKVPFTKLPPEIQKQYNYDPSAAQTFAAEKAAKAAIATKKVQIQEADRMEQEEKQETERKQTDASDAELKRLAASALEVKLTVRQIVEGGFLAKAYLVAKDATLTDDIFVVGPTDGLVDHAKFQAIIAQIGTKKFTTVLGAERTVAKYLLLSIGEATTTEPSRQGVSSLRRIGGG